MEASSSQKFHRRPTITYFLYHLRVLPDVYSSLDTNRITVCYFCLSALDLMDALEDVKHHEEIIEWIYSLQCLPQMSPASNNSRSDVGESVPVTWGYVGDVCLPCATEHASCQHCGFLGSAFLGGQRFDENKKAIPLEAKGAVHGHVAMTYTALACLVILGDDLSRVAREPILASLSSLQQEDGRFVAHHSGGESDCRFLYCACAIAFMLGGVKDSVNMVTIQRYVRSCLSYDGGIGLVPGQESHGGSTYTALAGLGLCAEGLEQPLDVAQRLGTTEHAIAQWCLARQLGDWCEDEGAGGFQGRLNKVADTCYTFWVLGALQVLDKGNRIARERIVTMEEEGENKDEDEDKNNSMATTAKGLQSSESLPPDGPSDTSTLTSWLEMYDRDAIRSFLLDTEIGTHDTKRGGFGKTPGAMPDVLHSYYGVCGLALIGNKDDAVLPLDATLSISERSRRRLKEIQKKRGWL